MRCERPLCGNVLVKTLYGGSRKNDKLILWYISEVFRPLWEQYLYSCLGTVGNSFFLRLRKWPEQKQREKGNVLRQDFCSYQGKWLQCSLTILGESPGMYSLYRVCSVCPLEFFSACCNVHQVSGKSYKLCSSETYTLICRAVNLWGLYSIWFIGKVCVKEGHLAAHSM